MPYSGSEDPDLPANVKKMSKSKREQWCNVWNSVFASCMKKDSAVKADCESSAFAQANGVAKKDEASENIFVRFWNSLKELISETEPEIERSLSIGMIYDQVRTELESGGEWVWINDIFVDTLAQSMFAITSKDGKLYKVPLSFSNDKVVVGTAIEVVPEFKAVDESRSTTIFRQTDGLYRFFQIACTAVLNRNGQIDSTKLFDSMVERYDCSKKPYVDFMHLGKEFRMGEIDYVARDGAVLILSGLFDKGNKLADAMVRAWEVDSKYWGNSILFMPLAEPELVRVAEDIDIPVYNEGELWACTFVPEKYACSLFTTIRVKQERGNMADARVIEALKKLAGDNETLADEFISMVDGINRTVVDNKLISREEGSQSETEPVTEPVVDPVAESTVVTTLESTDQSSQSIEIDDDTLMVLRETVFGDSRFDAITKGLADLTIGIKHLLEMSVVNAKEVATATETIKQLQLADDEKHAIWAKDLPRTNKTTVTYRPRTETPKGEKPKFEDIANDTLAGIAN